MIDKRTFIDIDPATDTNRFREPQKGPMVGKTIPGEQRTSQEEGTEVARLASKRGLIMLATEVIVRKKVGMRGDTEVYRVSPIVKVPMATVKQKTAHELAGHAARFTEGKPAEHKDPEVERIIQGVEKPFEAEAEQATNKFLLEVAKQVEFMVKFKEKAR